MVKKVQITALTIALESGIGDPFGVCFPILTNLCIYQNFGVVFVGTNFQRLRVRVRHPASTFTNQFLLFSDSNARFAHASWGKLDL